VKRFTVLDAQWSPGSAEVTATLKPRRSAIVDRYSVEIDRLYT
jgi:long-subunit acyl-CoA synthetase (AMP-forming)